MLEKLASMPNKPRYVVASGSVPPGVPDDIYAKVARIARELGAAVVIDSSGASLRATLEQGVTLVKPNLNEFSDFVGVKLDTDEARIAACRKLIGSGGAEMVALTLGEDGALLVTKSEILRAQPMHIEVVSAVGAGDSFLGGLVASLAKGARLEDAFRVAVAAASAAVMNPGTELCRESDLERLLPRVQIAALETAQS